jgi:predicted polyphosphate/ATP-dependent NAD kinase
MKIARDLKIEDYDAIVAVGGDGTCHEVVNGMMIRDDKKKLPICFLPNGSGNDLCGALSLDDFHSGLNALIKGETIKVDLFKVLLDHEREQDITANHFQYLRYCIINTSLLLVGSSAKNAVPLKPYIGKTAYTLTAFFEILKGFVGNYDIDIDNGSL